MSRPLTHLQRIVLVQLDRTGTLRWEEVAKAIHATRGGSIRVLDGLVVKGYAARHDETTDPALGPLRSWRITDEGRAAAARVATPPTPTP